MNESVVLNTFLQMILFSIGVPVVVGIVKVLFGFAKVLYEKAKAAQPTIFEQVEWAVGEAIVAAEQSGLNDLIDDKKAYALNAAEKYLATMGVTVDLDVLDAAIEAALFKRNASEFAPHPLK